MTENAGETVQNLGKLDYWSFVELARKRIVEELDDTNTEATSLIITLNRAANLVIYDLESSVHRPRGLSWSAFRLLFVVWLAGPLESGRAAKLAGMSRAAVSNLTNTLIAKGMLRKYSSGGDGRTIMLELTDEGSEYTRTAYRDQNTQEARWASALTEVEAQVLIMLLEKLMSHRKEVDARIRD
jgi:MarR family transcriptional regulator, negative regulator of the multidrug operon emrRAB